MKTMRFLVCGLLASFVSALALAATKPAKTKTYTVAGFVDGVTPSSALVDQAAQAVGKKMTGMVQIQNPDDADHIVEILFTRGKYQIFVDALPLKQNKSRIEIHKQVTDITLKVEMFNERNVH